MLYARHWKTAALLITLATGALVAFPMRSVGANPTPKDAAYKDFKFPIVLCRFKQAVLKDVGGILKVSVDEDWGPEYAFPVGNVKASNVRATDGQMARVIDGEFDGYYEIPETPYRLRVEGSIRQGTEAGGEHSMRFRTYLQKRDRGAADGKWKEVGQAHNFIPAKAQADGTVWENIYPYTFNSLEMSAFVADGKLKRDKVLSGIRDGVLEKGSVFKVGPACGFLDGRTAKSVASAADRERFKAIFDLIPDAPVVAQAPAPTPVSAPAPAPAAEQSLTAKVEEPRQVVEPVRPEENKQEVRANEAVASEQPQTPPASDGQTMSPDVQAQLAQQNQMADQAAAAYNYFQQQAQNGVILAGTDSRDPASMQAVQAAQNIQAAQSPEQLQQQLQQLEQQKAALAQQQNIVEQQQSALMQRQQEIAAVQAAQVSESASGQPAAQQPQPQSKSDFDSSGHGF